VQGSKRLYAITDAGRSALAEQAVALDGVRMRIEVSKRALRGHDRPPEIHEAVGNLRHALHMHSGRWTPEEIERVRDLLNDTAKAIASGPAVSRRHPMSDTIHRVNHEIRQRRLQSCCGSPT
jgi:DNA-binding PadR family transcriptional regulator